MNAVSLWWLLIVVIKLIYLVDANWISGEKLIKRNLVV
jgi:hypothetical protein